MTLRELSVGGHLHAQVTLRRTSGTAFAILAAQAALSAAPPLPVATSGRAA